MKKRYTVPYHEGTPEYDYDAKIPFRYKGVDLTNGKTFIVDGIDDLENNCIIIKCRACNNEYKWDKKNSSEDEWTSGLCNVCLSKEQKSAKPEDKIKEIRKLHAIRDHNTDKMVEPPKNRSWEIVFQNGVVKKCSKEEVISHYCYTETQIRENLEKLKVPVEENWNLTKFDESQINDPAFEISLIDHSSIFFKIIENFKFETVIERMTVYENWKRNNFDIFLIIESHLFDKTNEQVLDYLKAQYPDSRSPRGSNWTLKNVRLLREYMNQIPKDISREWEKWENTIRMMLRLRKILIPERLLIFKNVDSNKFSYKEIDALAKGKDEYFLIEAKYKGGDVNPDQAQLYIKALEKIGYNITAALYITAEEGIPKKIADNIYVLPSMWFSVIYDGKEEEVILARIKRAIEIAEGKFPKKNG